MKIVRTTYISIGSNEGDKILNLQNSVDMIGEVAGLICQISPIYKTKSWGFDSDDFYNICLEISTNLSPEKLLTTVLTIEKELGRKNKDIAGYAKRPIDIDILLFDDEIIFSPELMVPHPTMLQRNFVLVPLNDIAPNFRHPIAKKIISICLQHCEDKGNILKLEATIKKPISLHNIYDYIAIEGNIGAGKTTLAKMIGDDFNAKTVLERFVDNPFLSKYYKDMNRYAFPLEMSFLVDRHSQLKEELVQFDLFKNFIVSDYYIFKSLLFSKISLPTAEFALYRKIFDIMYSEIRKPDLYIYLHRSTTDLIANIKKRGRDYEQNITPEYLEQIQEGYTSFKMSNTALNILTIDVTNLDFANNREDYLAIIKKIKTFSR
jgi:2-amino-4-hydroxy-6-hydroxymethyldihydropteridine diphosphokinase